MVMVLQSIPSLLLVVLPYIGGFLWLCCFFSLFLTWKRDSTWIISLMVYWIANLLCSEYRQLNPPTQQYLTSWPTPLVWAEYCPQKGSFFIKITPRHYQSLFFTSYDMATIEIPYLAFIRNLGWQMSAISGLLKKFNKKKPRTSGRLSAIWVTFWHWHLTSMWCRWWVLTQKSIWSKSDKP